MNSSESILDPKATNCLEYLFSISPPSWIASCHSTTGVGFKTDYAGNGFPMGSDGVSSLPNKGGLHPAHFEDLDEGKSADLSSPICGDCSQQPPPHEQIAKLSLRSPLTNASLE